MSEAIGAASGGSQLHSRKGGRSLACPLLQRRIVASLLQTSNNHQPADDRRKNTKNGSSHITIEMGPAVGMWYVVWGPHSNGSFCTTPLERARNGLALTRIIPAFTTLFLSCPGREGIIVRMGMNGSRERECKQDVSQIVGARHKRLRERRAPVNRSALAKHCDGCIIYTGPKWHKKKRFTRLHRALLHGYTAG